MNDKLWNTILDNYLLGKGIHSEDYYQLNDQQKWTIQHLKKAFKRLQAKQDKYEREITEDTKGTG